MGGEGGMQLRPICHSAKAGIHPGQVASLSWGQLLYQFKSFYLKVVLRPDLSVQFDLKEAML